MDDHKRHPHFKEGEEAKSLLFDVVNDISSSVNLAEQLPGVVQRLMDLDERARDDLGDQGIKGKNVRSAGYVENPRPCK